MTQNEKLWALFTYVGNRSNFPYELNRIPFYYGYDWPEVYAADMMNDGGSVCFGYAAVFGYLASMNGNYGYFCNTRSHAWVEINGLIYDPVYLQSVYHTTIFGSTYSYAESLELDAGYEDLSSHLGTYMYEKIPLLIK